eukprot:2874648-Rhodomonas_salina.1
MGGGGYAKHYRAPLVLPAEAGRGGARGARGGGREQGARGGGGERGRGRRGVGGDEARRV